MTQPWKACSIVHHNSGLQYTLSGDSVAWIIIQVDTGTWTLDTGHQDQLSKDMINRRLRQPPAHRHIKVSIAAGQSANTGQPRIKRLKFRGGNVSYDHSLKIIRTIAIHW